MKRCLGEGELRARLDGELAAEQAPEVEQHLAECAACAAAYQAVSARAARVSSWMAALSEDVPAPALAPLPRRKTAGWAVWAGVAALAAGLVLAVAVPRKPAKAPAQASVTAPPEVAVVQPPVLTAAAVPAPVTPVRHAPVRRAARTSPVQYYVALDEEPIDTGLVMRVALASGMEADVIVDGGGRARAIRPVSYVKEER